MQIAPHLPDITNLINENIAVSIVAPTGSGKSVLIPQALAQIYRCFITVPTRTAAISLAEYQRILVGDKYPTGYIGHAAEGDIQYNDTSRIVYVTAGHAMHKLLSHFSNGIPRDVTFCDVLMVDEVHAGTLDTSIILSLWDKVYQSGVNCPRLLVASATPVPINLSIQIKEYVVTIQSHGVTIKYYNRDIEGDDTQLYTASGALAYQIHTSTDINTGHILVFAPGAREVELVISMIEDAISNDKHSTKKAIVIRAYGALDQQSLSLIYRETGPNERKIVVATNIAETAITIPDIGHVIDTMREKRSETSPSGGMSLNRTYISKDSAIQRAGRTGRTRPGVCYRMCTFERYEKLEQHRPPEIDRVPIYDIIMQLLSVGLAPETTIRDISTARVTQATRLLKMLELIDGNNHVTDAGMFVPKFHLSVRNATFLYKWYKSDAKYPIFPGIVTACIIDSYSPSYYRIPRKKPDQTNAEYNDYISTYRDDYFSSILGYSDLETALNLFILFYKTFHEITYEEKSLASWSNANGLNNKKIRELLGSIKQVVGAFAKLQYDVKKGPFVANNVINASRHMLLSVYSDQVMIHSKEQSYYSPLHKQEYRLDSKNAVNKFREDPPVGIIALNMAEIKTPKSTLRIISFALDTQVDGNSKPIIPRTTMRPISAVDKVTSVEESQQNRQNRATPFEVLDSLPMLVVDEDEPAPNKTPILIILQSTESNIDDMLDELKEFGI